MFKDPSSQTSGPLFFPVPTGILDLPVSLGDDSPGSTRSSDPLQDSTKNVTFVCGRGVGTSFRRVLEKETSTVPPLRGRLYVLLREGYWTGQWTYLSINLWFTEGSRSVM